MKLVIVESPTKAKTLNKYLGKGYKVMASNGHIRDLPKKELGVDVEKNFTPKYVIPPKAKKALAALKKAVVNVDTVVLATDLDREGEAIAWHLKEIFDNDKKLPKNLKYERVVFHELTKEAVNEAFEKPGKLNVDLVDAQQARRVLDRLVGYSLSPLLWKKVRYGLSAGRVQSVAVRLIVERERERDAFKPDEYWSLDATFETKDKDIFVGELKKKDGAKLEVTTKSQAKEIEKDLKDDSFVIDKIKKSERKRKPSAPFKTSTLQQTASGAYSFTARRTMSAAQKLFENGFITYHRTDAITLASSFVTSTRKYIKSKLGDEFVPAKAPVYKTKSKGAQEAHEAIRPTDVGLNFSELEKQGLGADELKLYSLILKRALESQIVEAIYDQTSIKVLSKTGYEFSSAGSVIKFLGWLAASDLAGFKPEKETLKVLPDVTEGSDVDMTEIAPEQHFTQPPARYSDATLIKTLEEKGIGRPSTYAPTISTIQTRKYVIKEARYFVPEPVAYVVTDLLVDRFKNVTGYEFTAGMEAKFDEIAEGKVKWQPVIAEFFGPFEKAVAKADEELNKRDVTKLGESDEKCPDCGKILYIKLGKYGKFLSCSGFPECEFAKPMDGEGVDDEGNEIDFGKCEKCEDGILHLKQGRFGKFLACNNYPKCKSTKPYLDKIGMGCPLCKNEKRKDGEVIIKKAKGRTFYGCSNYPDCKYSSWKDPRQDQDDGDGEN